MTYCIYIRPLKNFMCQLVGEIINLYLSVFQIIYSEKERKEKERTVVEVKEKEKEICIRKYVINYSNV